MESGADLALKCGSGAVVGTPVVGTAAVGIAVVGTAAASRTGQLFTKLKACDRHCLSCKQKLFGLPDLLYAPEVIVPDELIFWICRCHHDSRPTNRLDVMDVKHRR